MFKYVVFACLIAAVKANAVDDFIATGRWLVIAVDPPVLKDIMKCNTWLNISRTPFTSDCGEIKKVPVLNFTTDDGQSTDFPVVARTEAALETFVIHSPCDDTRIKMMLNKINDDFMTAVTLSNEVINGTVRHRVQVYGKRVPSFSELKNLKIPLNIPYCYQLDESAEDNKA